MDATYNAALISKELAEKKAIDRTAEMLAKDFTKKYRDAWISGLLSDSLRRALLAEMVMNRMSGQENQDQTIRWYVDLFHATAEKLVIG